MSLKKNFHRDLEKYATPSAESVGLKTAQRASTSRRRLMSAPIAIALSIVLIVGVAAAVPALVKLFNDETITEHSVQLTEVPEGYVGLYTVEDLVKLARDVDAGRESENYILMADIAFTDADYAAGGICEDGWKPIDRGEGNIKMFNGNGHVIRDLRISGTVASTHTGGQVRYCFGLFGHVWNMQIINLGIEGVEININGTLKSEMDELLVGGIVGYGEYVGASYVKDMKLNVELTDIRAASVDGINVLDEYIEYYWMPVVYAGGITGRADYVDACYVESFDFNISADGEKGIEVVAGGVASRVNVCASSWADGSFNISGSAIMIDDHEMLIPKISEVTVPTVMTLRGYEMFEQKLIGAYGSLDAFNAQKARAYFTRKSIDPEYIADEREREQVKTELDKWNKYYRMATGDEEYQETLFVFDPTSSSTEIRVVKTILMAAFESEQEYVSFCQENTLAAGLKYGATIRGDDVSSRTEESYPGFDFEKLWVLVDGVPRLKIFKNN